MALDKKSTHTGIVKNTNGNIVLESDDGAMLFIDMNGFNPDADHEALMPFVDHRVSLEGWLDSDRAAILINGVSDITDHGRTFGPPPIRRKPPRP